MARHPDLVGTLIAHEAPLARLLPAAEEATAGMHEIYDIFRGRGISAAWQKFSSFTGMNTGQDDNVDPDPPSAEGVATSERFFGHGLLPIALYQPDFSALHAVASRIVVAGGTTPRRISPTHGRRPRQAPRHPPGRFPWGPRRFHQPSRRNSAPWFLRRALS